MKTTTTILGPIFKEVGDNLYQELAALYPEGAKVNTYGVETFRSDLPYDDPRNAEILDLLKSYECTPDRVLLPGKYHFTMRLERTYSKKDWQQSKYLSPYFTQHTFGFETRQENGLLRKDASEIKSKSDFGGTWGGAMFISERLRPAVEATAFAGAKILPLELFGSGHLRLAGQFWELTSGIILPPLSERNTFLSARGGDRFIDRDAPEPSVLREGRTLPEALFSPPELHYRAKDLDDVPPFDIALTYEKFGQNAPHTVFSQKFYQFCVEHKLPISWLPVRIDEE